MEEVWEVVWFLMLLLLFNVQREKEMDTARIWTLVGTSPSFLHSKVFPKDHGKLNEKILSLRVHIWYNIIITLW